MGPLDSPPTGSYLLPIDTYGLSLTVFELFSWLQRRFRPTPDTMTSTAVEAIASSSGKNQDKIIIFMFKFDRNMNQNKYY